MSTTEVKTAPAVPEIAAWWTDTGHLAICIKNVGNKMKLDISDIQQGKHHTYLYLYPRGRNWPVGK